MPPSADNGSERCISHKGAITAMTRYIPLSAVILMTSTSPAWAYLDPGMSSIVLQGLAASFAAFAGGVSLYWSRIRSYFANLSGGKSGESKGEGETGNDP